MIWVLVALVVIGLGAIVGGIVISGRASTSMIEKRLGITEEVVSAPGAARERKTPVADALNRELARRGVGADLATQLARADLKVTVGEFLMANFLLVAVGTGVAFLLKRDVIITAIVCLVCIFGPRVYIGLLRGRRLNAFNNQLGDTINLMVNGIRAGYSVMQAMEAVSKEMGPPISIEFGRVVREVQLGLTLEQAMDNMLRRITSDDLDMMVTAVNVQREVGGNLAEVLDAISYTIRERVRIKGEIRALTAQSRWSGYLISLVPIVLAGVVYLINPQFMSLLFTERCGWVMLGVAVVGIGIGYYFINKIVKIEV